MPLVDKINWDNVPNDLLPVFPALVQQVLKGNRINREEAVANQMAATRVYSAFDELRFGVEQLTGDEVKSC